MHVFFPPYLETILAEMQPLEGVDELFSFFFSCLSSFSLMSFTVDLPLKARLCLCPPTISDLLKPYELDGSQGLSAGAL